MNIFDVGMITNPIALKKELDENLRRAFLPKVYHKLWKSMMINVMSYEEREWIREQTRWADDGGRLEKETTAQGQRRGDDK